MMYECVGEGGGGEWDTLEGQIQTAFILLEIMKYFYSNPTHLSSPNYNYRRAQRDRTFASTKPWPLFLKHYSNKRFKIVSTYFLYSSNLLRSFLSPKDLLRGIILKCILSLEFSKLFTIFKLTIIFVEPVSFYTPLSFIKII